ncbi:MULTISPECIES: dephospho-CoA kinase [Methylobacterium]|uniref:Dephospho-CoA kinase n=2 Tax=Pseudomonadota TaxID=1224 RepID=A0ABQ4SYG3_9HYPH|nr:MULTISPECIES: dephospho-CoA kinase [Methylobacterium]PIU06331.1 MAG: dephospho-CoA kinase [Methylobacterium sp. CG09_land_8_20_14_0_10_71_15]PIU13654.1 MAG: dephospho-CoA kinase [Methylobacterium sp. CG08_land_8_20_14_0_20_71_15]GBU17447.1 dephospho-CoA kinase [Methylobacterium sp.]GJE08249.1 Dephospho-CoA kinase [Methylobacterium jeotgali]
MRAPGRPFVLGLTGSIGMGKSTTASLFRELGVPVHDSDAAVHALYTPGGGAVAAISRAFPGTLAADGSVDRTLLRDRVLGRPEKLAALEGIVHPLVQAQASRFLAEHADAPLVVLDIPLLYETGGEARCDAVLVVTAPPEIQSARVLSRPGMTQEAFTAILAKQMPDAEKRERADHLLDTSRGLEAARQEVAALVENLSDRRG